jgi:hypothetical protein
MAVYPVGVQRVTESDLPFLIASSPKAGGGVSFHTCPPGESVSERAFA